MVGLPRKYETLVSCPLAPLQQQWYKRLLKSDAASHAVLTVSQLKTLIMQLRKICNHPRTLLAPKDAKAGGTAAAASSSAAGSSSLQASKAGPGGGGKKGERVRAELAALSGEELVEVSSQSSNIHRHSRHSSPLIATHRHSPPFTSTRAQASMTKSCNLATLLVFGRLVEHVTEGWFSSAGRMTFDITLNWVLAKWADLPMGDVMDYDTMRRFRTMVDVVTSTHFYNRSYPAFISLVSTLINLVFVFGFAIYLSSMEGANSQLSTLLPLIYICVFILLAAVRLTSTRGYLDVERRWLEHDGELAIALDDFLG